MLLHVLNSSLFSIQLRTKPVTAGSQFLIENFPVMLFHLFIVLQNSNKKTHTLNFLTLSVTPEDNLISQLIQFNWCKLSTCTTHNIMNAIPKIARPNVVHGRQKLIRFTRYGELQSFSKAREKDEINIFLWICFSI
jgi:hypothetical protein